MIHHGQHTYFFDFLEENFKETPIVKNLGSKPTSVDGYIPKNKKLLTYPYCYLGFNPQNGNKKVYRYEDFEENSINFKILSEINPNPTVQFIPEDYRGQTDDSLSDNTSLNGYPTISFKTDTFNVWLAQNSDIISLQMQQEAMNYNIDMQKSAVSLGSDIGSVVGSVLTQNTINPSNVTGAINTGIEMNRMSKNHEFYIKNQMAQIEKQSLLPDNASLSSSNSTLLGYDMFSKNIFTKYSIKRQFAKKLDKYFDMFGYTINELKNIDINSRTNWNYIKTQGANLLGNIPEIDLESLKELFDNGITFWHNPETYLDYSQNNN